MTGMWGRWLRQLGRAAVVGTVPHGKVRRPRPGVERLEDRHAPAFLGGVRPAVGDVDGDGYPDVVVAQGSGGATVSVFDGRTGQPGLSFTAYAGFTGGASVAVGDVDGDGRGEIVTGAGAGGGPHVRVFDGRTGAELQSLFAYEESFRGGGRVRGGRDRRRPGRPHHRRRGRGRPPGAGVRPAHRGHPGQLLRR